MSVKNGFDELCEVLAAKVKSGNIKDDNDPEIRRLMEAYTSDEREWARFATYVPGKYTRNLVREDDRCELILLCWYAGCKRCVNLIYLLTC